MYRLYASLLTLLLLAVVDCSVNKEKFDMKATLTDKVCPVNRRVFERKAVSLISCVMVASRTAGCSGVSYNEEQHMCYGCSTSTDDNGEFETLPGTVFYSTPIACPGVFQNISGCMMMVMEEEDWTYDEANSTCAVCSASLVRIDSPEKQVAIKAHLDTLGDSKYWIQCRKDTSNGVWKFDDGAQVPMTNDYWEPRYPANQTLRECGYMHFLYEYRWVNYFCDRPYGFICEIK